MKEQHLSLLYLFIYFFLLLQISLYEVNEKAR